MYKSYLLVALYLALVIGITACEKRNSNVTGVESGNQNVPIADRVGRLHNIALDEILKNTEMQKYRYNYSLLRKALIQKLSNQDPELFDQEILLEKADEMQENLKSTGLLTTHYNKEEKSQPIKVAYLDFDFKKLFHHMKEQGTISQNIYKEIIEIYKSYSNAGLAKRTYAEVEKQLKDATKSYQDEKVVSSFLQVLKSSDSYWAVYNDTQKSSTKDLCELGTIWVDAAGAAYGMIAGPIWSIIEGALFSSFSHMNCTTN